MKPSSFKYVKPLALDEAFDVLEHYGEEARVLAGGQSLMAGLGMRLGAPGVVVDINGIDGLSGVSVEGDEVVIGATTRHVEVLNSPIVAQHLPLIAEAITHVAHMAIRNRGTFGGSLAYADPAAELPACTVAYGGTIVVGSRAGQRRIPADDFFVGMMETALQPGELILQIRFPFQEDGQRHVFAELARRHGDFALVGLAGIVSVAEGQLTDARLVYFGCASYPRLAFATSSSLVGQSLPLESVDVLQGPLNQDLDPGDSPGMRADTRLKLAAVITRRQLNALQEVIA